MPTELTLRQAAILAFIRRSFRECGCAPTIREIGAEFGFSSPNAIAGHLRAISRKGYIRVVRGRSRGIELVVPPGCCMACGQRLPEV